MEKPMVPRFGLTIDITPEGSRSRWSRARAVPSPSGWKLPCTPSRAGSSS
ncbi:hypothetical protein V6574_15645 [Streptomyces sp. SM1P]